MIIQNTTLFPLAIIVHLHKNFPIYIYPNVRKKTKKCRQRKRKREKRNIKYFLKSEGMAKLSNKRNGGIVKFKIVVEKLQKSLSLMKNNNRRGDDDDDVDVPEDVKEGHFAVIANANAINDDVEEEEEEVMKRFILPLSYLTHPTFLRLLEQAAEEYGFDRGGALTIPCRPSELQKILSSEVNAADCWDSCNKTMVQTF